MPLRVGIIGAGVITERLLAHMALPAARRLASPVGLADPLEGRARALAASIPGARSFPGYEEMLAACEPDVVLVASPIPLHAAHVQASLEAGCHVHCQKTLATTAAEAARLVELAGERGRLLGHSPNQMLLPAYRRAAERIASGAVGRPYNAVAVNSAPGHEGEPERRRGGQNPSPAWYYRAGGGPLADMGVYSIHALIGLLGPPVEVSALSSRPVPRRIWGDEILKVSTDDNVQLLLRMAGDVLAAVSTSYSAEAERLRWGHLAVSGESGSLEVRRSDGQYEVVLRDRRGRCSVERHGHGLDGDHEALGEAHVYCDVRHLLQAVAGEVPLVPPDGAVTALAVMDAAARSAAQGRVTAVADFLGP